MQRLTRRRLLIGLAGAAGLAGVGGILSVRDAWFTRRWITALIRDHLAGARIDQAGIDAFAGEVIPGLPARLRLVGVFRTLLPGLPLPVMSLEAKAQLVERKLLSEFLIGSNFFWVEPAQQPIEYAGPSACPNPFARFDAPPGSQLGAR